MKHKILFPWKRMSMAVLTAMVCLSVSAQSRKITGRIVDTNGEPIIGASIIVDGAKIGAMSDLNGNFSIELPDKQKLKISYVGYVTQVLSPKSTVLKITMQEDFEVLDEVVVVGYGTQKMKNVTGSIETIDPKEIVDLPVGNLGAALRGLVNGLSVNGGQTRPGSQASLTIRNPFTKSKDGGTTEPIYVIDDFITDATAFNNLDPNEIESISVLKDAAAAVYGARSSQGAVLVKTKRGTEGKTRISYSAQLGWNDEISRAKLMNAYDYGVFWNRFTTADITATNQNPSWNRKTNLFQYDELETMKGLNYDRLDEAWSSAMSMKHNINISGGSQKSTFFASVSYFTQDGNLSTLDYERWNYRAGMEAKLTSHAKVSFSISGDYGHKEQTFNKVGGEADETDYNTLQLTPRYIPTYYQGFPLAAYGVSNSNKNQKSQQYHFYEIENTGDLKVNDPNNLTINGSFEYDFDWFKPLQGLKMRLSYAKSINNNENNQLGSKYTLYTVGTRSGSGNHLYESRIAGDNHVYDLTQTMKPITVKNGNRLLRDMERTDKYQLNLNVTYNRTFGKHTVGALFSMEKAENEYEFVRYYKDDPLSFNNGQSNTATGGADGQTTRKESGILSYIGRLNYSYADKYLFEALIRSDASTKFAPENYWGVFPSVSTGWVISEENWFKEQVEWVEFLKFRLSFGLLGKDNTKPWLWRQRYTYQGNKGAVFGTSETQNIGWGLKMEAAPNYNAKWDKRYMWNFGIDSRFLNNRLSVTIDAYYNRNSELLVQRDALVPVTIGGSLAAENYDEIDDYGVELSLGWRDKIGDVNYYARFSTGFSDSRYRKKDWPEILTFNSVYPGGPTSMGTWGYDYMGMFRSQEDIDAYVEKYNITEYMGLKPEQIKPGMLIYRDIRGEQNKDGSYQPADGIVDGKDLVRLARRVNYPSSFTLNLGGSWKGLSLSAQIAASWGGFSNYAMSLDSKALEYTNVPVYWNDMFCAEDILDEQGRVVAPANPDGKYPNMAFGLNKETSNFWKISPFRMTLRTMTLAYSLPKEVNNFLGIQSCRFNLTGMNLFSFFNPYPKHYIDPMSSYGSYPTLRNISMGINVSF